MNASQERIYSKIIDLSAYSEDVIRARILFCQEFQDDPFAVKEASKAWGIKAKQWAKIPATFPTEWERELDTFELLTLAELIKLDTKDSRADMAVLAAKWRDETLTLKEVRRWVDELTPERKPREPKADKSAIAEALDDLILAGTKMSNLCYNGKQTHPDPLIRQSMETTQNEWDAAVKAYRELTK